MPQYIIRKHINYYNYNFLKNLLRGKKLLVNHINYYNYSCCCCYYYY